MIPSNVDPRRPDKVQRYKAPQTNGNPGEDMTPDYMNILGPEATAAPDGGAPDCSAKSADSNLQLSGPDEPPVAATTNATSVIPTSPQYGVAIIPNTVESPVADTLTTTVGDVPNEVKLPEETGKELHSTPSRNERFKVVKIASLEPFKRGRWKCMDYVDESPPQATQPTKIPPQSAGSVQLPAGMYLQTQSLPQQHIQQMLLQGGFAPGTAQFFPGQVLPPNTQFFYAQPQQQPMMNSTGTMAPPTVGLATPQQFMSAGAAYFQPAGVVPTSGNFTMGQNFQGLQYVPTATNLLNQGSAFVPTTQNLAQLQQNFQQQAQTYAAGVQQAAGVPLVNGHGFPAPGEHRINEQWQQCETSQPSGGTPSSLPTQAAKNVIMAANAPQQAQQMQAQSQQQYAAQVVPVTATYQPQVQQQQQQQQQQVQQQQQHQQQQNQQQQQHQQQAQNQQNVNAQNFEGNLPKNVYTNPQFVASVNSLPLLDQQPGEGQAAEGGNETSGGAPESNENSEDPAKTNPVVNAIDNKIEQAMDLVKSHLMYTVREEVEVLKEKIAELMERIQQLETENNFLRSQIPKCLNNQQQVAPPSQPQQQPQQQQQPTGTVGPDVVVVQHQQPQQQQQQPPQQQQPQQQQQQPQQ